MDSCFRLPFIAVAVLANHDNPLDDRVNRIREILFSGYQSIDELKRVDGQVHDRDEDKAAHQAGDSPPQGEAHKGDNHDGNANDDGPQAEVEQRGWQVVKEARGGFVKPGDESFHLAGFLLLAEVCADASDGLGIAGMATTSRLAERRQGERQSP